MSAGLYSLSVWKTSPEGKLRVCPFGCRHGKRRHRFLWLRKLKKGMVCHLVVANQFGSFALLSRVKVWGPMCN